METFRRSWAVRWLHLVWQGLGEIVYPPACLGCNGPVPEAPAPLCPRCAVRLERVTPEELAAHLHLLPATHAVFDTVFALWHFDKGGTLQAVQHALKYGHRPRYGRILGEWIGQARAEQPPPLPPDTLTLPVPLHRIRQLERGYNQSAMLAEGLAARLGLAVRDDLLVRHRPTRSQTRLSRTRRWQNVDGAFAVADAAALAQRPVLLVDDVLTTGATVAAAAQALKQAGAASVHLATLALAR